MRLRVVEERPDALPPVANDVLADVHEPGAGPVAHRHPQVAAAHGIAQRPLGGRKVLQGHPPSLPSTGATRDADVTPYARPFRMPHQYSFGRTRALNWYIVQRSFDWSNGNDSRGCWS